MCMGKSLSVSLSVITGDTVPSVTMSVDKVQLLSSKNKE